MRAKVLIALAAVFVAANIGDLVLTRQALSQGAFELNPIMAVFAHDTLWEALLIKGIIPILISILLIGRRKVAVLSIVAVAFVLVCIWNAFIISQI